MNLPRTLARASLDDADPATLRAHQPLSTALLNLLPLALLVGAVSADRFGIRWHGVNLRLELIAAVVLAFWAVVTWRVAGLRIGLIEYCLAGWLVVGVFASIVFSPAPRESLRLTLLLVGMVAIYGLAVVFIRSGADLARVALVWIAVGTVVAAIGIVEAILYALVDSHLGIAFDGTAFVNLVVYAPRVTSTMWEANIFASYLLTVWALAFALSRVPTARTPVRKWALRIAMGVIATAVVISTTRVVWVVAPLLMLSMMAVALRLGLLERRRLLAAFFIPNLAGIAAGLALALAMPVITCPTAAASTTAGVGSSSTPASGPALTGANPLSGPGCFRSGSVLVQHAHGFLAPESTSSFTGRLKIARLALQGWLHRPVFGNGSGSYLYVYGPANGGWIGNLELHVLFDTGIVGFGLLLVALVAPGRAAFRALRGPAPTLPSPASGGGMSAASRASGVGISANAAPTRPSPRGGGNSSWETPHYVLFGLVAAALALILTYQFTDGTWLGFTWVFFGMLVAGGRLTRGVDQRLRSA